LLSAAGCGTLAKLLPGEPWSADYWENRDGQYYVGSRCSQSLVEIGVFLVWPTVPRESPSYFDTAVWHATAPDGVPEFNLFATDHPGVSVTKTDGDHFSSNYLYIEVRDVAGHLASGGGVLDKITNNMVGSAAGVMTWDEFMRLPNSDFGC